MIYEPYLIHFTSISHVLGLFCKWRVGKSIPECIPAIISHANPHRFKNPCQSLVRRGKFQSQRSNFHSISSSLQNDCIFLKKLVHFHFSSNSFNSFCSLFYFLRPNSQSIMCKILTAHSKDIA